jgi:cytochrome c biogenesis protein CcdA
MRSVARYLLLFLLSFPLGFPSAFGSEVLVLEEGNSVIYYSEACQGCKGYIDETLIPLLRGLGVKEIIKRDYLNEPSNRRELFEFKQELGLPPQLQGHITTFVNKTIILEGHVPGKIITDLMTRRIGEVYKPLVIYQDEMEGPSHYQVWVGRGEPRTFLIVTGLLDGVNPCAFAVLLFFIAFLFTLKKTRHSISWMGITYIAAIYLTYFLIGLGLLKAFGIGGAPHVMARVGAFLVILLGVVHIKDYFFPNLPVSIRVPKHGENAIVSWAYKATFPAAVVLGFLVGLCTFPCSGGIYVATIGLLQSKATFFKGLGYLVLYNLMFVLPLVFILMGASSRVIAGKLLHWERVWKGEMHLFYGAIMIAVGVVILAWFV